MSRIPNLNALLAFRHAGEELSFKKAAEHLNVSQAAISQNIRLLEDRLGVRLFNRLTREVELTREGKQLLGYASSAFQSLEDGLSQLADDPRPRQLNISTLPSFASRWLIPRMGKLQETEPELSFNITVSPLLTTFQGSDIDVAIRLGEGHYEGLVANKLFDEYVIPVCHPALLNAHEPVEKQIENMPVLQDESTDLSQHWKEFQKISGIELNWKLPGLHINDTAMLVEAALNGQGFTLIRFSMVADLLARGLLVCPLPLQFKTRYDYYLVAPPAHFRRPKFKRFEHWLVQEFSALDHAWRAHEEQTG